MTSALVSVILLSAAAGFAAQSFFLYKVKLKAFFSISSRVTQGYMLIAAALAYTFLLASGIVILTSEPDASVGMATCGCFVLFFSLQVAWAYFARAYNDGQAHADAAAIRASLLLSIVPVTGVVAASLFIPSRSEAAFSLSMLSLLHVVVNDGLLYNYLGIRP